MPFETIDSIRSTDYTSWPSSEDAYDAHTSVDFVVPAPLNHNYDRLDITDDTINDIVDYFMRQHAVNDDLPSDKVDDTRQSYIHILNQLHTFNRYETYHVFYVNDIPHYVLDRTRMDPAIESTLEPLISHPTFQQIIDLNRLF